jgi:hypothetical protein
MYKCEITFGWKGGGGQQKCEESVDRGDGSKKVSSRKVSSKVDR